MLPNFADYIYRAFCIAPAQYARKLPKTVDETRMLLASVSETWHPALEHLACVSFARAVRLRARCVEQTRYPDS